MRPEFAERHSGFKIYAKTRIRLFHYRGYGDSREEAGLDHLQAKEASEKRRPPM